MNTNEKPPLGLEPRWLHDSYRINDILNAMERYADSKMPISKDWIEELKELIQKYMFKSIKNGADG